MVTRTGVQTTVCIIIDDQTVADLTPADAGSPTRPALSSAIRHYLVQQQDHTHALDVVTWLEVAHARTYLRRIF
jgi:hypothetical protein